MPWARLRPKCEAGELGICVNKLAGGIEERSAGVIVGIGEGEARALHGAVGGRAQIAKTSKLGRN